jgi:hypothetical protein
MVLPEMCTKNWEGRVFESQNPANSFRIFFPLTKKHTWPQQDTASNNEFKHGSACSITRPHRRSLLHGMYGGTGNFEEGIPYNGVSFGSLLPGRV